MVRPAGCVTGREDWWIQNRLSTDHNQISVTGRGAANGSYVRGCLPVTAPCHFSLTASSPRTSQSGRCNLQSFSGDPAKWKAAPAVRGGAEIERRESDLVSPCIYLPDTLTSAAPAENPPDSSSTTLCTWMLM